MTKNNTIQIQAWVGDLHEYTTGNLVGEWIDLPMDLEEIMSEVLTHKDHEYYVADIDSDIKGLENLSLSMLNEVAEKLDSLPEYQKKEFVMVLNASDSIEEGLEMFESEEYRVFHNCESMSEVAMYWYEETGLLHQMNEAFEEYVKNQYHLPNVAKQYLTEELTNVTSMYLDYEAIGRDMEIKRNFHKVNSDTYIELFR